MQSTFTPGRADFWPLCRWVRGLTDTFLLGWVLAMLVSGCVTYSRDKAVLNMSDEEKTMLARLDTIKKGMTKAEVQAILGPGSPLGKNALDYYLGTKKTTDAISVYVPSSTLPTPDGRIVQTPTTVTTVPVSGVSVDSCARVKFKNNAVTQIHFTAVGRWFFYVMK